MVKQASVLTLIFGGGECILLFGSFTHAKKKFEVNLANSDYLEFVQVDWKLKKIKKKKKLKEENFVVEKYFG